MQAVIMAGGRGTRLLCVTRDEIPKPMALVNGKPILEHQLQRLKENGITDIILVVGYLSDKITAYFGDGSRMGVSIQYVREDEPLGTAGAFPYLREKLRGGAFLLVFGDVVFDIDIARMLRYHNGKGAYATLFVHPNSHPHDSDLVLAGEDGRITGFLPKTGPRQGFYKNCVNAGFYILDASLLPRVPCPIQTDLEKDILWPMARAGERIFAYHSPEYIMDAGTPERIARAARHMQSGRVAARNLKHRQKCIFLDRDGTINRLNGLACRPEQFILEESAADAIRLINDSGYLAIVVTNQPAVARGLCGISDIELLHNKMHTLLGEQGAYLDDVLYCPHHPDKGFPEENPAYKIECLCRKPKTGMIDHCVAAYNIDECSSWMIGDTTVDMQAAKNAGLHAALVRTGEAGQDGKFDVTPDMVCDSIYEAVRLITGGNGYGL